MRGSITHQRNLILNLIKIECTFIFFLQDVVPEDKDEY